MNSKQADFTVTFVRHGETDYNKCRILQGQSIASSLNGNGKLQAEALGRYLSADVFTHIFSSDLLRAKETVDIILSENKAYNDKSQLSYSAREVKLDSRLREKSFGVLEGKEKRFLVSAAKSAGKSVREYVAEGGETPEEFEERAHLFFKALCDECYAYAKDQMSTRKLHTNVLVLTHGHFLVTMFLSISLELFIKVLPSVMNSLQIGFTVTWIRHGETELNRNNVLQGQGPIGNAPLNETGKRQAHSLKRSLSSDIFTHIYSSDLLRAKDTAEIALQDNKAFKDENSVTSAREIKLDSRIRERGFGVLEGRAYGSLYEAAQAAGKSQDDFVPDGGESEQEVDQRAEEFFQQLCDECYIYAHADTTQAEKPTANVVVFSHGGLLSSLVSSFANSYGCKYPSLRGWTGFSNTSKSCFTVHFKSGYKLSEDSTTQNRLLANRTRIGENIQMACTLFNDSSHIRN